MNLSILEPFVSSIVNGLKVTLYLTMVSVILGTVFGMALSTCLDKSRSTFLRYPATVFVEVVRAVPPLVWLIWVYFVLPLLINVRLDATFSAGIVFTVIYAAFSADVFRGARDAIPRGTTESALALGMDDQQIHRRVIITEIIRRSFPALNGQAVGLLKMSSLASVIAVPELTYAFQIIISRRPIPFEVYTGMALAYCAVIFPLVWLLRYIEAQEHFTLEPKSHA